MFLFFLHSFGIVLIKWSWDMPLLPNLCKFDHTTKNPTQIKKKKNEHVKLKSILV